MLNTNVVQSVLKPMEQHRVNRLTLRLITNLKANNSRRYLKKSVGDAGIFLVLIQKYFAIYAEVWYDDKNNIIFGTN